MASVRAFVVRSLNLLNFQVPTRCHAISHAKRYSVYSPIYVQPTYRKDEIEVLQQTQEYDKLAHVPIRPAITSTTCSHFHDKIVMKFTNYLMRNGNRILAKRLIAETFEHIKIMQLERYNSANLDKRDRIDLDPKVILYKAIENCRPVLQLESIHRGGIVYQVPAPVGENRSSFLAMNWLLQSGKEKDRFTRFTLVLAKELIDASKNQGRVVKKKQELHRQCEANRAYAHFRWMRNKR